MTKYKLEERYKGTHLEDLIKAYNEFQERPKFYGERAYKYMRSLRIEIAETRKQINKELKERKRG